MSAADTRGPTDAGLPGSVQCLGTTATPASGLRKSGRTTPEPAWTGAIDRIIGTGDPEPDARVGVQIPRWADAYDPGWLDELEYVWSRRTADKAKRLDERARRRYRQARSVTRAWERGEHDEPSFAVILMRSAEWAEHRAQAMRMRRADVADACARRSRTVVCGCGPREALVLCEQPQLCERCRKKHAMLWRKRIVAGMEIGLRDERAKWYRTPKHRRRGMLPGIYLITLTGPHSGDIATDRDAMGAAVRKLLKHATWRRWWSVYALTWEATNGDDGRGHLHCHLAVISTWVPYSSDDVETDQLSVLGDDVGDCAVPTSRRRRVKARWGLHDVWRWAMPGARVLDVRPPGRAADPAFSAGNYLAKYVTKGVEPAEFTGRKAGELLVAFQGRRKVSTSEGFWVRPITACACCGEQYRSAGAPCSLRVLNPGAYLSTFAGYFSTAGPQTNLDLSRSG